jgi:hypothetical protein
MSKRVQNHHEDWSTDRAGNRFSGIARAGRSCWRRGPDGRQCQLPMDPKCTLTRSGVQRCRKHAVAEGWREDFKANETMHGGPNQVPNVVPNLPNLIF